MLAVGRANNHAEAAPAAGPSAAADCSCEKKTKSRQGILQQYPNTILSPEGWHSQRSQGLVGRGGGAEGFWGACVYSVLAVQFLPTARSVRQAG